MAACLLAFYVDDSHIIVVIIWKLLTTANVYLARPCPAWENCNTDFYQVLPELSGQDAFFQILSVGLLLMEVLVEAPWALEVVGLEVDEVFQYGVTGAEGYV